MQGIDGGIHRKRTSLSRRDFLKVATSATVVAGTGAGLIMPRRARAGQKTLKILQWDHFVPEFDKWFNHTYVQEWGKKNDTNVIVDNVGMTSLYSRAAAEVAAQSGHDLFMFLLPPPAFEDHV